MRPVSNKPKVDRCTSCGAKIIWAKRPGESSIPLNATRVRFYSLYRSEDGGAIADVVLKPGGESGPQLVYVSHFVSCPKATAHSRGGES